MQSPENQALGKVLDSMASWGGQPHKWRRDVLLIGTRNWLCDSEGDGAGRESANISWLLVRKLRAEEETNGGFLTLETLCRAMANLSKSERERLSLEEFPALGRIADAFLLSPKNSLLAYLGQQRPGYFDQIRSARGLSAQRLPCPLSAFPEQWRRNCSSSPNLTVLRNPFWACVWKRERWNNCLRLSEKSLPGAGCDSFS